METLEIIYENDTELAEYEVLDKGYRKYNDRIKTYNKKCITEN